MTDERHHTRGGLLDGLYGRVTEARRAWYGRRPSRRRRLRHPVISVGNLASGGSGKTPVVAAIARLLRAHGERPAILSRGYGRREAAEGVVVVSDGQRVLEPVTRSGDEPQLLARSLVGVPVLVSADRYLAGAFGERTFGVTVSLLDDGFQHVQLERDIDLLLVSRVDLAERLLPWGHLREPLSAARFADALLVSGADEDTTEVARACGHESAFRIVPRYGALREALGGSNRTRPTYAGERVLAVAGIARPERFFAALRAAGWNIAQELTFPDHHWYSATDIETIDRTACASNASAIVTTEKDAVRLPERAGTLPILVLPMAVEMEPVGMFESWLLERLARARQGRVGVPA